MTIEDYPSATSIPAVSDESEPRGRNLSAGEGRSLFEACARPCEEGQGQRQDSAARRRRDAAFLALACSGGLRRSQTLAADLADFDMVSGERGCAGQGPQGPPGHPASFGAPCPAGLAAGPRLRPRVRSFAPVLKSGRGLPLLTSCAGPGSGICSTWVSIWPPCRRWHGMPRPLRRGGTIAAIRGGVQRKAAAERHLCRHRGIEQAALVRLVRHQLSDDQPSR